MHDMWFVIVSSRCMGEMCYICTLLQVLGSECGVRLCSTVPHRSLLLFILDPDNNTCRMVHLTRAFRELVLCDVLMYCVG